MEVNGLPLHPLVVHAAVVFGPLAAAAALVYFVPRWHDRLRWPMLVLGVIAGLAVVAAYLTGDSFRESNAFFNDPSTPVSQRIDKHESWAQKLLWTSLAFSAVAVLTAALHRRTGAVRIVLNVLLVVTALAVLVLVVLTGDAGSRAVWDGFAG